MSEGSLSSSAGMTYVTDRSQEGVEEEEEEVYSFLQSFATIRKNC
jgi:hypothetical protein